MDAGEFQCRHFWRRHPVTVVHGHTQFSGCNARPGLERRTSARLARRYARPGVQCGSASTLAGRYASSGQTLPQWANRQFSGSAESRCNGARKRHNRSDNSGESKPCIIRHGRGCDSRLPRFNRRTGEQRWESSALAGHHPCSGAECRRASALARHNPRSLHSGTQCNNRSGTTISGHDGYGHPSNQTRQAISPTPSSRKAAGFQFTAFDAGRAEKCHIYYIADRGRSESSILYASRGEKSAHCRESILFHDGRNNDAGNSEWHSFNRSPVRREL
jgi:hypothetical protein